MGIVFFLIFLVVLSFGPVDFAHAAYRCNNKKIKDGKVRVRKMSHKDAILSNLPIGCVTLTYKSFYKSFGYTKIVGILAIICILPRLLLTSIPPLAIAATTNTALGYIQIYSLPLCYFGFILFHLLHVVVYIMIMRLFRFNIITYILTAICPYATSLYLATSIPNQLNAQYEKLNNRFSENYKTPTDRPKKSSTVKTKSSKERRVESSKAPERKRRTIKKSIEK